ncbi:Transmembrane protein with metallophosphoesterase domain [Bagarius yarrelli]|uniref:Transmembrane protein with metallophosphoesterase domain n=1 Tax=Bagarius yarrelli TaxID=175774 RepID=A0A556VXL5_BAGYA|nr:Transmembrane protein with metallophosphoesterase domain [Bagarius yarrelli]
MFGLSRLSAEGKVGVATGVVFFSMLISRTVLSERVDITTRARLFRAQFLLLINSLLLLGSLHIWKRVVTRLCGARLGVATWSHRCWRAAVLLFLSLAHCSYLSMFYLVDTEPHWLSLLSFSCLGVYVILLFLLVVFGCVGRMLQMFSRGSAVGVSGSSRQTVLALMLTALLAVYGLINAAQPPQVVEVEIPLEKLPDSMDGLKMVLLSDIHLGPTVGRSQLQRVVTMVNQIEPGDPFEWRCRTAGSPQPSTRLLLRDRYPDHGMDVEKAVSGCSEEHPIVLLAHQPRAAKQALQRRPDINLVLSGHTHAGQIFPLTLLAFLVNPFFCGLYRISEHSAVYVTPGTVYYGIPMRIGSRAEITLITLKSA